MLFAHWRVEAAALRRLIPGGLELDLFGGQAYVGAVPFTMEGLSPRLVPDVPGLHRFPELNLRTYVQAGGKPSVWFFSLDAGQRLAVRVARRFFHLPYFDAKFQIGRRGEGVEYSAVRTHRSAPKAGCGRVRVEYWPNHKGITVNRKPVKSGATISVDLASGPNKVEIAVTPEKGTVRTYMLAVTR